MNTPRALLALHADAHDTLHAALETQPPQATMLDLAVALYCMGFEAGLDLGQFEPEAAAAMHRVLRNMHSGFGLEAAQETAAENERGRARYVEALQ